MTLSFMVKKGEFGKSYEFSISTNQKQTSFDKWYNRKEHFIIFVRHEVNSIPELHGNSNSRIAYLKKGIWIDKFGIEVCYKNLIHKFTT